MDDSGFRLLMGLAGVAFGAIQLYFRSEWKQLLQRIEGLERRSDKSEFKIDSIKDELRNLFSSHVIWVQKEIKNFIEKCELYRNEEANEIKKVNGNTRVDQEEIIKMNGKIDLLEERFGKVEQFFYEGKSLWESKAEILERLEMLEARK